MAAEEKPLGAMLIQRLKDHQFIVRVHAGVLLGGMGVRARPACPLLTPGSSSSANSATPSK
jgi:hypothetical protein